MIKKAIIVLIVLILTLALTVTAYGRAEPGAITVTELNRLRFYEVAQRAAANSAGAIDVVVRNPVMADGDMIYYHVSGWYGPNRNNMQWRDQILPLCLRTNVFLPPLFSSEYTILAGQTGISHSGTFWLALVPYENILRFIEVDKEGRVLQTISVPGDFLHSRLGSRDPLPSGIHPHFSVGAFAFAVLENGIVINYYCNAGWANTMARITFDRRYRIIEQPGRFPTFFFYDSYNNSLIIRPRASEEIGYPSSLSFRLDGATLRWQTAGN